MSTHDTDGVSHSEPIHAVFKPLADFEARDAEWVVDGWIPKGQITLLAADGGVGKTTVWGDIVGALSSGGNCILDPEGYRREPQLVAVFSTEDSVESVLKPRLLTVGADPRNIITMDITADKSGVLKHFKLGSPMLAEFVRQYRPTLCVLDPIQGFIPPDINMGSRNAMRDCMDQLVALGAETGTSFLVVCHTNKRSGAAARNRVSDSSDLWDISRSVAMMGHTDQSGVRYLSHEKSNYGPQQDTVLITIHDGSIERVGTTWKRDQDYVGCIATNRSGNKREECRDFILRALREAPDQRIRGTELKDRAQDNRITTATLNRVRAELSKEGVIMSHEVHANGGKTWYVSLREKSDPAQEEQLSLDGVG